MDLTGNPRSLFFTNLNKQEKHCVNVMLRLNAFGPFNEAKPTNFEPCTFGTNKAIFSSLLIWMITSSSTTSSTAITFF